MFSTFLDEIFIENACLLYRLSTILFFESLACTSIVIIRSITNRGASTVVMRSDRHATATAHMAHSQFSCSVITEFNTIYQFVVL